MHQSLQGGTFHIDHIVPLADGGTDGADNLCLACPGCNLHKSDRRFGFDRESGVNAPLFNPRKQIWSEHFRWTAWEAFGTTSTGRVTIEILEMNADRRILIRRAEQLFGLFPPAD